MNQHVPTETIGRSPSDTFTSLKQRIHQKLNCWYTKLLSPAVKKVLLKSVVTAIPTYTMSCFLLPKKLINQLMVDIRRFWWSNNPDKWKISWVAWNKIVNMKTQGGLGIRDFRDFNTALLAKQGWRLLSYPQSLLARVYQAKYYPKENFLQATPRRRMSYAWKSILHGQDLLKQRVVWNVGNGKCINAWKDNWLPVQSPKPPRPHSSGYYPKLQVSDLFITGTHIWDQSKLQSYFHQDDVKEILKIRPSITGVADSTSWMHSPTGFYTVKSGYSTLRRLHQDCTPFCAGSNNDMLYLFAKVWKLNVPPKVKTFWWRVLHNSLPVATQLTQIRVHMDQACMFCGEARESLNHLMFQCRVAKEVWGMAPSQTPSGDQMNSQVLMQNIRNLFHLLPQKKEEYSLLPFIGWNIWKARNVLAFQGIRQSIVFIISKALLDLNMWKTANDVEHDDQTEFHQRCAEAALHQQRFVQNHSLKCMIDASWISSDQMAGIAWTLRKEDGSMIVQGSSAIPPLPTPLEAEAEALKMAVVEVKRLGYDNVCFMGDCSILYTAVARSHNDHKEGMKPKEIAMDIEDILKLSKHRCSSYVYITRNALAYEDQLAKLVRRSKQGYVINQVRL